MSVAVDRERAALAPLPRLVQRVRQQGEGAGLACDLPYQQIDQARLQQQADLAGGTLDRGSQFAFAHGAQQMQPGLDESGEVGVGRQLAEAVGAQGDDHRTAFGVCGEVGEEHRSFSRIVAKGEHLLALVDHQDRPRPRRRQTGSASIGRAPGVITTT